MYTEEELIAGCRKGNSAAQEALYKKYASRMRFICMRYARTNFEVEDIFQDAFMKIFLQIDKYKGDGSFDGWVKRVVVNTAIDYYKKSQRSSESQLLDYDSHDLAEEQTDTSNFEKLAASLSKEELLEIINQLPEGYRMVFNLYAIEGYSHKEIASLLNISEGTSKSQLSKARAQLQRLVTQYVHNDEKIINVKFSTNDNYGSMGALPA